MQFKREVAESFSERYVVDEVSGCWNWAGGISNHGYGVLYAPKKALAHRFSWLIHRGDIPRGDGYHGTVVMHVCDNRRCVNPDHLRLGSQADNVQDMLDKGRKVSGVPSGVKHWRSAIKDQADIDLICATKRRTKELAELFGVDVCTIKRIRQRNGAAPEGSEKFRPKEVSQGVIDAIRATPAGTRGLTKKFGLSKTAIAKIRKGITYAP